MYVCVHACMYVGDRKIIIVAIRFWQIIYCKPQTQNKHLYNLQVYTRLDHLNVTLSYTAVLKLINDISERHRAPIERWMQEGASFKFVGDNVDKKKGWGISGVITTVSLSTCTVCWLWKLECNLLLQFLTLFTLILVAIQSLTSCPPKPISQPSTATWLCWSVESCASMSRSWNRTNAHWSSTSLTLTARRWLASQR